jgi:membrane-bound ClpP family serine protease
VNKPATGLPSLRRGFPTLTAGTRPSNTKGAAVIITGVLLIILAMVLNIPILYTIGIVLAVAGAILWILGTMGRAVGPRPHYW